MGEVMFAICVFAGSCLLVGIMVASVFTKKPQQPDSDNATMPIVDAEVQKEINDVESRISAKIGELNKRSNNHGEPSEDKKHEDTSVDEITFSNIISKADKVKDLTIRKTRARSS